ncbi:MAG: stage IV sporulation protein A, partial [Clostridia bacterium]|nr:stage IV sporulation protein A [Clostridia bacterium]
TLREQYMDKNNIYQDIATRTNGDIYVGVVGPVRVGKSTFITQFMQKFVLPNMSNDNLRNCEIDELPQSADGVGIMTTQPKFVPSQSVRVDLGNSVMANIRLIDCVGYLVEGATGHTLNNKPRMVNTPWSKEPMPFDSAAELGTHKVLAEHSSVAILLTTDGSFGSIPRENFVPAEERLVRELKEHNKPFVVIVNSATPDSESTIQLVENLTTRYNVGVLAIDVSKLTEQNIQDAFGNILREFPIIGVELNMPEWLTALPFDNEIITEISHELKNITNNVLRIGEFDTTSVLFNNSSRFLPLEVGSIELGSGKIIYDLVPKPNLFYEVLSNQCGMQINSDYELVSQIRSLAEAKHHYDKLKSALDNVAEYGYGVVQPTLEDMVFEEPSLIKQGSNRWGVRLRASAPSLHIMRVDVETEISPMVGSQQQSMDLVEYLNTQSQSNPNGIWDTNMFGKSVHQLMTEGLSSKINTMPIEAQKKMRKTLTRIVNEGKGGIICILL